MNFSPKPKKSRIPLWVFLGFCVSGFFTLMIGGYVVWQMERFEKDMDISVPTADAHDEKKLQGDELVISIRADGDIVVDSDVITTEALIERLHKIAKANPDQAVILRGHKETDFQSVIDVLDEIKVAGIWNVAFAPTKP